MINKKQIFLNYENLLKRLTLFFIKNNFLYPIFLFLTMRKYKPRMLNKTSFDIDWANFKAISSVELPINNVKCYLKHDEKVEFTVLSKTPHHSFLEDKTKGISPNSEYYKYFEKIYNYNSDLVNERIGNFLNLFDDIKNNRRDVYIFIKKDINLFMNKEGKIIDGLHRATILNYLGINKVKCIIIDEVVKK
jgi:hypothetical protein